MKWHERLRETPRSATLQRVSAARRTLPLLAWLLGLVAVLVGLHAVGGGALGAPDLGRPVTWADWAGGRTAAEAAMAVLRLVALALGWYLLAVTVLAVALRLGRGGSRLVTVADAVTLPFVRGLVHAAVGMGLAGAAVAAVGSATSTSRATPTVAAVALVASVEHGLEDAADEDPVLMQRLPADDAAPVMQQVPADAAPAVAVAGERTWVVGSGDHLWSIAERVLTESWGRTPADAETARFWEQVVEHNRAGLADPANPDLIFPGQRMRVPAPPPAP